MSPVSPVFHIVVTVSIGLKNGRTRLVEAQFQIKALDPYPPNKQRTDFRYDSGPVQLQFRYINTVLCPIKDSSNTIELNVDTYFYSVILPTLNVLSWLIILDRKFKLTSLDYILD